MIPNTTPSPRKAAHIILVFISLIAAMATCHEFNNQPGPALPPDHSSLDSGWIEEHSEKEDSL